MSYSRTLTANPGGPVDLKLISNAVSFEVHQEDRWNIEVLLETDAEPGSPEAEAINEAWGESTRAGYELQVLAPAISMRGGGVQAGVIYGGVHIGNHGVQINDFSGSNVRGGTFTSRGIKATVRVPALSHIQPTLQAGSLRVYGNAGQIVINQMQAGSLRFESAMLLDGSLQAGSVNGTYVHGLARIFCQAGSIWIDHVHGDVDLESQAAGITVGVVDGSGHLITQAGSIDVGSFRGEALTLRTQVGNIRHPEHRGIKASSQIGRINGVSTMRW